MILAICQNCGIGYSGSENPVCPTCYPIWFAFEYRCRDCGISMCISIQGQRQGQGRGPVKVINPCLSCDVGELSFVRQFTTDQYRRWTAEE